MEEGRVWIGGTSSSYMFLEATGDSEAQCSESALTAPVQPAEDDAQSCSCGSMLDCDSAAAREVIDGGVEDYDDDDDDCDCDCGYEEGCCSEDYEEEEEEEDGVVEQCRRDRGEEAVRSGDCTACGDHANVKAVMSEKERDKLFWEACLAPDENNGDQR